MDIVFTVGSGENRDLHFSNIEKFLQNNNKLLSLKKNKYYVILLCPSDFIFFMNLLPIEPDLRILIDTNPVLHLSETEDQKMYRKFYHIYHSQVFHKHRHVVFLNSLRTSFDNEFIKDINHDDPHIRCRKYKLVKNENY